MIKIYIFHLLHLAINKIPSYGIPIKYILSEIKILPNLLNYELDTHII